MIGKCNFQIKNVFFMINVAQMFHEDFIDSLSALSYFSSREFADDAFDNLNVH